MKVWEKPRGTPFSPMHVKIFEGLNTKKVQAKR